MKVLGPNETGKGILIEYDSGHISPQENKQIISEMKNMDFTQDLILYAVLQKYGVPNKNGRIYPESILRREYEKYLTIIKKGGALNELNHPTCQTSNAQVLTNMGWKYLKDISDNEKVYTYKDGKMGLSTIYEKKSYLYNGDMIHIKGRNIDTIVTPNHNIPIINKNTKKLTTITAQEIFDIFNSNINKLSNFYIPKTSIVDDTCRNINITIKGLDDSEFSIRAGEIEKIKYKQDLSIPADIFCAFMGIYLSEGYVNLSKIKKRKSITSNGDVVFYESSKNGYKISITQKTPEKVLMIEELMNLFPLNVTKYTNKKGIVSFNIYDRRLHKYLKILGKSHQKYIPREIKELPPYYLDILFKWYKLGDGRTIGNYKQSDVFSTSKKLIYDLQEILIKCGKSGNVRKEERGKDRYIKDNETSIRLIKGINTKPMWFLNISKTNGIWLDKRFIKVYKEKYNDYVYSIDVPNHIYYTKENEKCHWTGNSSLIDLDRISHSIMDMWWEDNILMGKIKIFTSPGWRKMGIISCKGDQTAMLLMNGAVLGISSRGVGSLKNIKGQNIVQDDFELVCFDIVSSPSTPGAYIFKDPSERKQYDEDVVPPKDENSDKIKSLMGKLDNFLGK